MFEGCSSLQYAPSILPAMDLMEEVYPDMECYGCYERMFYGCTHLETTPILPALKLVSHCYSEMFYACMKINHVECLATDISATDCTTNWMFRAGEVASNKIFVKGTVATWTTDTIQWNSSTLEPSGIYRGIPSTWTVQESQTQHYLTFTALTGGNITWNSVNNNKSINYSKDNGTTWTVLAPSSSISVDANDIVLIKGELYGNSIDEGSDKYCYFSTSNGATFNVSGNIMSLIEEDDYIGVADLSTRFSYKYLVANLFKDCSGIRDASELTLPAITLSEYCYYGLFKNSGLTKSPKLPAVNLAKHCYESMFEGCTSYDGSWGMPTLAATNLYNGEYCYMNMFKGCTGLTWESDAFIQLPATKLAEGCYLGMFEGCTGIYSSPTLPAESLPSKCYKQMFKGCTSLNKITSSAWIFTVSYDTSSGATNENYPTKDWTLNVSNSGTFVSSTDRYWVANSVDGIPSGWSVSSGSAQAKPNSHVFWDDEEEGGSSGSTETPTFQANSDTYSKNYLTIEAVTDGVLCWNANTENDAKSLLYSFDGINWDIIVSSVLGEKILL